MHVGSKGHPPSTRPAGFELMHVQHRILPCIVPSCVVLSGWTPLLRRALAGGRIATDDGATTCGGNVKPLLQGRMIYIGRAQRLAREELECAGPMHTTSLPKHPLFHRPSLIHITSCPCSSHRSCRHKRSTTTFPGFHVGQTAST